MTGVCVRIAAVAVVVVATAASPIRALDGNPSWTLESAPRFDEEQQAALAAALDEAFALSPAAGLSVGVLWEDHAWTAARGLARLQPPEKATPQTTYRMASVTKTFTAVAVMKLAEEGKLSLDDEVQRFVPSFPRKPWPVTVRALLNHTSGIAHYRNARDARFTKHLTVPEALAVFQDRELLAEPGLHHVYSSFGYNLLGAVVESASGMSYGQYLKSAMFLPLGMTRSELERSANRGPGDAWGYRVVESRKGARLVPSDRMDISSRFAGGGTRSTAEDMLRWARALLAGTLVTPATWAAMTTPTVTRDGRHADYGYGFAVYPLHGLVVVAHAGGQWETSTFLYLVPSRRLAVVLASNVESDQKRLSAFSQRATEILLEGGRRRPELTAPDPVDDVILDGARRIFSWGIATHDEPRTRAEVDLAFAQLPQLFSREAIAAAPDVARTRIRDAFHPAFGRVSPLVGGEIADRLEREFGAADLERLRMEGPLAFLLSYDALCTRRGCEASRVLPASLVADLKRMSQPGALTLAPLAPQPSTAEAATTSPETAELPAVTPPESTTIHAP